ncbi:MAG: heme-binding protein [Mucilaginibacter polytrichastri]|nr:heme-binding protein [Mucilaginibacter polytrichastri]
MELTLEQAERISDAAKQKAQSIGVPMNIAIVDAGANLKSFHRMENAWLGSIDISIRKAKTARYFDMPTGEIGKLSQPGGALYQIEVSNGGLISFPGGIPIKDGSGTIIGAIGVSGGSVDQDHEVASAGLEAFTAG